MRSVESIWVVDALLEPLARRFCFHFLSARDTDRIDRPEWFYRFSLKACITHRRFIASELQPILRDSAMHRFDAFAFFVRSLVALVRHKLTRCMGIWCADDALLCHAVDETLDFDQALDSLFSSSGLTRTSIPRAIDVFTDQDQRFNLWLEADRRATESAYQVLEVAESALICTSSTTEKPNPPYSHSLSPLSRSRPTNFAESLANLFHAVTERYRPLNSAERRRSFAVEIQKPLLVKARCWLMEQWNSCDLKFRSLKPGSSWKRFCGVLETSQCLVAMLQDLAADVIFLEKISSPIGADGFPASYMRGQDLHSCSANAQQKPETEVETTTPTQALSDIFTEDLNAFEDLCTSLVKGAAKLLEQRLYESLENYLLWFPSRHGYGEEVDISPHFREFLAWLSSVLTCTQQTLGRLSFDRVWQGLTQVFMETLMDTLQVSCGPQGRRAQRWSLAMAAQFRCDVQASMELLQSFSPLSKEEPLFCVLDEMSLLAALPVSRLTSLLDNSRELEGEEAHMKAILAANGVWHVHPKVAIAIISSREETRKETVPAPCEDGYAA